MGIEEEIQCMIDMTQEAFTACLECHNAPVGEHREEELKKFTKEHPEYAQYHRDMFPGGISSEVPDWTLVQPAICFIGGVCCSCCEENHKGIWDMCQQARKDYERENAEMEAKGIYL